MKVGQDEECENALRRLRGEKADISEEKADIKVIDFCFSSNKVISLFF